MNSETHPWGDFLDARLKCIAWMHDTEKYSDAEIADALSMDEEQALSLRKYIEHKKINKTMKHTWKRNNEYNNQVDDKNYLVTWQDCDGCFQSPIIAYWMQSEKKFFPLHDFNAFPLHVDWFCEVPELDIGN